MFLVPVAVPINAVFAVFAVFAPPDVFLMFLGVFLTVRLYNFLTAEIENAH